ncbi:hypothetical protein [Desulfocurvus sp. DL9XJH121]
MSSHLAALAPGGRIEAEVDGDSVFKIEILARHHSARIAARETAPSGHVLLTLEKTESEQN